MAIKPKKKKSTSVKPAGNHPVVKTKTPVVDKTDNLLLGLLIAGAVLIGVMSIAFYVLYVHYELYTW